MHRGWKVVVAVAALVVMGMTAGVLGMQVQGAKADPAASSYLSIAEVVTRAEQIHLALHDLRLRPAHL